YRIAYQHFEEYEKIYPERYEEEYGYFRKIITATICKYLDCGIMENGFVFSLLVFKLKKAADNLDKEKRKARDLSLASMITLDSAEKYSRGPVPSC
ncbi:MAG: hypothetical protein MUO31_10980, partial [Thermodesulfovibrionales bacterium]|nr:hypothetical protein [Thermodesulfovibrionales bacterium]